MTSAAIINQQQGGSAPGNARALWLEGTNVLREPGDAGNRYGVLEDSITVTERGPGGVSAMTFVLRDPGKAITLAEGADVLYHDQTNDRPEFLGWVQGWGVQRFGLGRAFTVRCQGVEAVLDWLIVPSLTLPAGTLLQAAIQACAAAATGPTVPLRAFSLPDNFGSGDTGGSQAEPVAEFKQGFTSIELSVDVVIAVKTLREAIAACFASSTGYFSELLGGATPFLGAATVDFYYGLRAYRPSTGPNDYAGLTVADTVAATYAPENLQHSVDAGGRPRQVYVKGGNAAGSGMFPDGSGIPGPTAVINETSILTAQARDVAAAAYLRDKTSTVRGSLEVNGHTIATNVRAGSILALTDSETGATGSYAIAEIVKRYAGPRQDWRIAFGGLPLSLGRQVRRLTRDVLS